MKLGEALALRADLQKRMNQLQSLLKENITVQEGDRPAVRPEKLLDEYRQLAGEHEAIVRSINRTNLEASLVHGEDTLAIADAVVRRERLAREARLLRELATAASPRQNRFLRTEIRHVPTVDIADLLAAADRTSKEHRELDTRLQEANWQVDLLD